MALEVISSTVNNVKVAQPAEPVREVRNVEAHTDVTNVSTSQQIERQVVSNAEQKSQNGEQRQQQSEDAARIQAAVKRANNSMRRTSCQFSYNEETNRVSITVLDDDTKEVIREIPSEEALELVQKMWEMAGLMVDEQR